MPLVKGLETQPGKLNSSNTRQANIPEGQSATSEDVPGISSGEDAGREEITLPYIFQALCDSVTIATLPYFTCAILKQRRKNTEG